MFWLVFGSDRKVSFWVSMAQPVIQVRDLGKLYRIRSTERKPYSTFREDMVNDIKRSVRGDSGQSQSKDFWALR
jgi:lipopolysaccharide transport system ATP-binding protein